MIEIIKQNRLLFALAFITGILTIVVIISALLTPTKPAVTKPSPSPSQITLTLPGKTTESQVTSFKNIKSKAVLENGVTVYTYPSNTTVKDNEIQTQNGVVIFERNITSYIEDPNLTSQNYMQQLGTPERVIEHGSRFYGSSSKYLIFASKGTTLIVDSFNDKVLEIQKYQPMSVDEYIQKWGSDITYDQKPEDLGY